MFNSLKDHGVIGSLLRGERGVKVNLEFLNPKDYCVKNYKGVDDSPYGGGAGMVMRADVLKNTLDQINCDLDELEIIYTGPRGETWNDKEARSLADTYFKIDAKKSLVFICGRYEGIDERFIQKYVSKTYCIGDFIMSGGELAVSVILDSALRFVQGALGNKESNQTESFSANMIEHPHYTKPRDFEGIEVPEVLLSGDHKKIENYRKDESLRLTKKHRPDLLKG